MLQSVSAHLMDERRQSRNVFDDRQGSRYSRRGTLADALSTSNIAPTNWYGGIGVIDDFQPSFLTPADNPLGWAVFNPIPSRAPSQKRNRCKGMIRAFHLLEKF
ncbi:unnamed protein product [Nippostrongylus brasiliensis]|uniref:Uncharacterized protein n=1 Tax=Nippostrongylus brasiliensis TaxID=27835 RepID=A0A0N4XV30_NIPBR|nr:unnamed protein product [Nippostrongylus brasiliensis]